MSIKDTSISIVETIDIAIVKLGLVKQPVLLKLMIPRRLIIEKCDL